MFGRRGRSSSDLGKCGGDDVGWQRGFREDKGQAEEYSQAQEMDINNFQD
jgi:hypothetical protein